MYPNLSRFLLLGIEFVLGLHLRGHSVKLQAFLLQVKFLTHVGDAKVLLADQFPTPGAYCFKYRFYDCMGMGMARPTGQMTAIEKIVWHSQTPRGGRHNTSRATWGNSRADQEAEKVGGTGDAVGKSLYCDFYREEQARQGKQVSD